MNDNKGIHYARDDNGIVTLSIDMPGPVNTLDDAFLDALQSRVEQLENDKPRGVVLTSAKNTFFAGGNLKQLLEVTADDLPYRRAKSLRTKQLLRRLERLGAPVAAAINGAALGGGFEICLGCTYRIALQGAKTFIGLPEVNLGLLPGCGGVIRTLYLLGFADGIEVVLGGARYSTEQAQALGLIDAVAEDPGALLAAAKRWLLEHPDARQPWDRVNAFSGGAIPSGTQPDSAALAALPAQWHQQLAGRYGNAVPPAPRAIVELAETAMALDFEPALLAETEASLPLMLTAEAKRAIGEFLESRARKA